MNKQQREKLRNLIEPLIQNGLQAAVEEEVGKLAREVSPTSYTAQILNSRDSHNRGQRRALPEAARVFARLGLVAGLSSGDHSQEIELARTLDVESFYKQAQSAGSAEGGGLLIIDDMAGDIIELLRPFSVVRQIGARSVGIPRGTLRTPRITAGVSSAYVGEG